MAGVARAVCSRAVCTRAVPLPTVPSPTAHEMDRHHARGEGGDGGGEEGELETEVIYEGHLRHRRRGCRQNCGRGQVRLAAQGARYEVLVRAHERTCIGGKACSCEMAS